MTVQTSTYDVYLASSLAARSTGDRIEHALESADLTVFNPLQTLGAADRSEQIWEALQVCYAYVMVLEPDVQPDADTMLTFGAAMARNKPIIVVHSTPTSSQVPSYLAKYPRFTLQQLPEVANAIALSKHPFSDLDREQLVQVYEEMDVPLDVILVDAVSREELAELFGERTQKSVGADELAVELLRLRKAGILKRN